MGRKSFYTPKIKPSSLVLGSSTLSGVTGSADTVQNSDNYLMSSARVNTSIAAKNTSTPINEGMGSQFNWVDASSNRYFCTEPWTVGQCYSASAKGYGSYAYLQPFYLPEEITIKHLDWACYNGSSPSSDQYLYGCIYNLNDGDTLKRFNMPNARQGWFVCKNPSGTGTGYTYFSTVDLSQPSDRTDLSYNHLFNSSGSSVSSLTLAAGHYWIVFTSSTTSNVWQSWSYSHRISPRMLRLDYGLNFPSVGYRITTSAWMDVWDDAATNKNAGTWAPPNPFDLDDDGSATDSTVNSKTSAQYMNINFPNVGLLCD
jgi:hypothetical protein